VTATNVTADELLLGFTRALRAAGVAVTGDRSRAYLDALDAVGLDDHRAVYWAGRATLCAGPEDFRAYDQVFHAWFGAEKRDTVAGVPPPGTTSPVRLPEDDTDGDSEVSSESALRASASGTEILRHRDIASMSMPDRAAMHRLLAAFRLRGDLRRSRRTTPSHLGRVDAHRTLRRLMQAGGEPVRPARRDRRDRPRRVVLLVDVSGSMSSYADALLRFAHAASHRDRGPTTEVFTIGTRLTRVTREMAHRDPDVALKAIAASVPDWSGGTRLGVLIKEFLDAWGQRGMARGAVVVVLSDGWERGDATRLGEQMARLHRLAHRVVWANPRAGRPGFAPLAAGMAAALPSVDDFVSGHSIAALEQLARLVAGTPTREPAHA